MGRRVALHMLVGKLAGDNALYGGGNILLDCWVRPFIDRQGGGGMGVVKVANSRLATGVSQCLADLIGNVNQLDLLGGVDGNCSLMHIKAPHAWH